MINLNNNKNTVIVMLASLLPFLCSTITVSSADVEISWGIPTDGGPLASETASVGDTVTFDWEIDAFHDVYKHPSGTCDEKDSVLVGDNSGASYTFTEDDVGDNVFACHHAFHCGLGQIVTVTVKDNSPTVSPAPTSAPVSGCRGEQGDFIKEFLAALLINGWNPNSRSRYLRRK